MRAGAVGGALTNYRGSNYGSSADYVDLYAPGYWPTVTDSGIVENDGATSFASPMVSGAAALLRQVNPDLPLGNASTSGTLIYILLHSSSTTITDTRPGGSGYTDYVLDLDNAVQQAFQTILPGSRGAANDIEYYTVGSTKTLHLVWYSTSAKALLYATRNNSSLWSQTEVVDAGKAVGSSATSRDVGVFVSMALDSSGNPYVAYYDSDNGDLRYAVRSGGTWARQAIDTSGKVGYYPSIKVSQVTGRPAISYYRNYDLPATDRGDLKFAQWTGSVWSVATADVSSSDTGRYSRLAFDPGSNGRWAIAYDDTSGSRGLYIYQQGGVWSTPAVIDDLTSDVAYTDLVFDPVTNLAAVSYYDTNSADLRMACATDRDGQQQWQRGLVSGNGIKGLYTNLRYTGNRNANNKPIWDIIFHDKTGTTRSVYRATGATDRLSNGVWQDFSPLVLLASDGGAELTAAWSGSILTISYARSNGLGLTVTDV